MYVHTAYIRTVDQYCLRQCAGAAVPGYHGDTLATWHCVSIRHFTCCSSTIDRVYIPPGTFDLLGLDPDELYILRPRSGRQLIIIEGIKAKCHATKEVIQLLMVAGQGTNHQRTVRLAQDQAWTARIIRIVSHACGRRCHRSQATGHRSQERPQVTGHRIIRRILSHACGRRDHRSQATDHRSQERPQATGHRIIRRILSHACGRRDHRSDKRHFGRHPPPPPSPFIIY